MSFAAILLVLIMKHEKSEKTTKMGRKTPRSSTSTAGDNDSGACGAVTWRPCRGRGWVTAIDVHCMYTGNREK
ncbi:hypothetical protein Y032_0215g2357 [Ancylostoma ceylanicum]|uniref:Uncharacterized protein n=1 Tax=Ancylostoma ceylanicum TaxID=53326 RepID=A0A016SJ38_9BILA|nr:hypothetical protein Y032_0215g2357 [Ancylostoma ceylanicum]